MYSIPYYQYSFTLPENVDKDIIISILADDYDFEGFVETDTGFLAYVPSDKDQPHLWMPEIQSICPTFKTDKEIIEPKNWNEEWEKNYDIAKINDHCEIYAPFHTINPDIKYPIFIEPKMSFGTGHHATTFMMTNLLFDIQNELKDKKVIDVGCGTGILGIVAKKLGASSVWFIDNDPICIENTKENILKNFPSEQISNIPILLSDIQQVRQNYPNEKWDIIIANIQKNVILNDLPHYKDLLLPNAYVLISGILKEHQEEIITAAQPLKHIKTFSKDEWIALLFQN